MNNTIKLSLLSLFIISVIISCKKDDEGSLPTVITKDAVQISAQSAICNAEVTSDGGTSLLAKGVCWSNSADPDIDGSHTNNGTETGSFSSSITALSPNTTYYYRAYATNENGTAYGESKTFKTTL